MREEPVLVATLHDSTRTRRQYYFYAIGEGGLSGLAQESGKLVALHKLPKAFADELRDGLKKEKTRRIGHVKYAIKNGEAVSAAYWPKSPDQSSDADWNKSRKNREWKEKLAGVNGLGAYLELIALTHAEKHYGVKTPSTTIGPSKTRIMQLRKAGLIELNAEEVKTILETEGQFKLGRLYEELRKTHLPIKAKSRDWKLGLGKIVKSSLEKRKSA